MQHDIESRLDESPPAVVRRYLEAHFAGDTAEAMVRDDFVFAAPMVDSGSKQLYFAGSAEKMQFVDGIRVLRQWHDEDDVATMYEIDVRTPAGSATMPIVEWHTVGGGRLASSRMVFDTGAAAAQLLHRALHDAPRRRPGS